MAYITGLRRDKTEYTPQFVKSIDEETCIGCGRGATQRMPTHNPMVDLREGCDGPVYGVDVEDGKVQAYREQDHQVPLCCDPAKRRGIGTSR